jgi:diguanylate cyclase (GGDEF)-like protein
MTSNAQSRAPRRTIGEFERDIEELAVATPQVGNFLPAFTRALSLFLDGSTVTVHLYDEEDDEFVLRGSTPRLHLEGEELRFRAGKTIPGLAVAEHRTVSLSEDSRVRLGKLRAEEHAFPLEAGGRVLGAVTVIQVAAEPLSPVRLDRARRGILRIAAILDRVRSEEALARRMSRLSAINEFGVILVSALSIDEVPSLATAMTSFIMGTEGCILRLRDEQGPGSAVRDAHGLRDQASSREILKLEELASREVLNSAKALLVRDVARSEQFRGCTERVKSFICCPISEEGRAIGTITLFNKDPESPLTPARFSQEDQDVLLHLVRYIEKAIANAALFAKSRGLAERDELTGLPDRDSFRARLLTEISRARRFHLRIALLTCSIQPPPPGEGGPGEHDTGQTLRRVAQAIRTVVRDYDTVGRIAEQTFGIILPQVQNGMGSPIARIQEAIDREVEQQRQAGNVRNLQVRFSHATFPDDGASGEQMLTRLEQQA